MDKRSFLKSAALTGLGTQLGFSSLAAMFEEKKNISATELAQTMHFGKKFVISTS